MIQASDWLNCFDYNLKLTNGRGLLPDRYNIIVNCYNKLETSLRFKHLIGRNILSIIWNWPMVEVHYQTGLSLEIFLKQHASTFAQLMNGYTKFFAIAISQLKVQATYWLISSLHYLKLTNGKGLFLDSNGTTSLTLSLAMNSNHIL